MSKARELRILDEIAPLYSRGVTQKDIAARLGISGKQVGNDIQVLKQHWNESLPESSKTPVAI